MRKEGNGERPAPRPRKFLSPAVHRVGERSTRRTDTWLRASRRAAERLRFVTARRRWLSTVAWPPTLVSRCASDEIHPREASHADLPRALRLHRRHMAAADGQLRRPDV